MSGTGQEDGIDIVLLDKAIEVNVGKAEPGAGPPVAQQPILYVLWLEAFTKQGIIPQINHAHSEVIARTPICIDFAPLFGRQGMCATRGNPAPLSGIHISECCFHDFSNSLSAFSVKSGLPVLRYCCGC